MRWHSLVKGLKQARQITDIIKIQEITHRKFDDIVQFWFIDKHIDPNFLQTSIYLFALKPGTVI